MFQESTLKVVWASPGAQQDDQTEQQRERVSILVRARDIRTKHLIHARTASTMFTSLLLTLAIVQPQLPSVDQETQRPRHILGAGTAFETPWFDKRGVEEGPTILITGGMGEVDGMTQSLNHVEIFNADDGSILPLNLQ